MSTNGHKKLRHDLTQVKNWLDYLIANVNEENNLDEKFLADTLDASIEKLGKIKILISKDSHE